jgi:hypothetical protein
MKNEEIKKITQSMGDDDLAALNDHIQEEIRGRRPKFTMDDIKVGMSKETSAGVRAELERVMKELTGGR